MLNSATLTAILVNILAALFFDLYHNLHCYTFCQEKTLMKQIKNLINNKCYGIIAVIFTIINFIASFTAIAVAYVADSTDYYHISIPKFSYLSLILVAGIIEFLVVKAIVFKKISCSKKERAKQAAIFAAICTPYYIIAANLPIIMYMVAVALYPC